MWAVRHRGLLGLLFVVGGFFVGFQVAELLDGHVALKRGTIGLLATGLFMVVGDLVARRYGGEGEGMQRYAVGPSLRYVPVFVIGLFFLALAAIVHQH